jgi:IS5 family transposase
MLRERALGETLWESVLPVELRELPPELGKVDGLLDEERLLEPFRARLRAGTGRPTIPIETYLRLMFLKHRYGLGYETLCREVSDSLTWRRFCRIPLGGRVPDSTTLIKLTRRLGPELVEELNAELLSLAVEREVLRSRRLRVDTTVVESDTRYPTDSGLCATPSRGSPGPPSGSRRPGSPPAPACVTVAARWASESGGSRRDWRAAVAPGPPSTASQARSPSAPAGR